MNLFATDYGSITDFAPIPTRDIADNFFNNIQQTTQKLMVDESEDFVNTALPQTMNDPQKEVDYNAPV